MTCDRRFRILSSRWAVERDDRPTFEEIMDRLGKIQFKVTAYVNSAKAAEFVKRIENWEKENGTA
jgi:hypothetical protein